MTDHAAAVEAVRGRGHSHITPKVCDICTLLRAYEALRDTNNELSMEIASLLSERRNRK